MAANPLVTVELDSTSRRVDVIGEGIDVALRVRFPPVENSELTLRVLGSSEQQIVASPALINQGNKPIRPADLGLLPSLDLHQPGREHVWKLDGPDKAQVRIPHTPRLVTDDMSQLLHAAIEGVGVVQLPAMVAGEAIQAETVVDLLPDWRPIAGSVQAIFPSRRGLLPSVRSLIDFLVVEYQQRE